MAAFVAGGHRKANNYPDIGPYKGLLTDEDLVAIRRLTVILCIAESFDRSMSGLITDINCDVLGDSVIMKTISEGDCSLEIVDALNASNDFKLAFGKNLEIL